MSSDIHDDGTMDRARMKAIKAEANRHYAEEYVAFWKNLALIGAALVFWQSQRQKTLLMHAKTDVRVSISDWLWTNIQHVVLSGALVAVLASVWNTYFHLQANDPTYSP